MPRDRKLFDSLGESSDRHRKRMGNVREALARGRVPDLNPPPERNPARDSRPSTAQLPTLGWDTPLSPNARDFAVIVMNSPGGAVAGLSEIGRSVLFDIYNPNRAGRRRLPQGRTAVTVPSVDDEQPDAPALVVWDEVGDPRTDFEQLYRAFQCGLIRGVGAGMPVEDEVMSPEARGRARSLLLSLLTPVQREQYARGYIEVRGQLTALVYRIDTSHLTYNVRVGGGTDGLVKLCATPSGRMPKEDKLLGQVMGLKCDERSFLRAANMSPRPGLEAFRLALALRRFADGGDFREPASDVIPDVSRSGRSHVAVQIEQMRARSTRRTFIYAGSFEQYRQYLRARGLSQREYPYLSPSRSTWGLYGFPLIRVGTWYARGDRNAVEELIAAGYFGEVIDER